ATAGIGTSPPPTCPSTARPTSSWHSATTRRRQAACSSRSRPNAGRCSKPPSPGASCSWPGSATSRRVRALSSPELPLPARLARVRALEVSPALFRWLALGSAAILYVIVVTGATVRLTASGLGCDHWPGCQAGQPFPEKGYHSYIEFGNRLVGGITIVVTLLAALAAQPAPWLPRYAPRLARPVFARPLPPAP